MLWKQKTYEETSLSVDVMFGKFTAIPSIAGRCWNVCRISGSLPLNIWKVRSRSISSETAEA